jgi:hypothetical protein
LDHKQTHNRFRCIGSYLVTRPKLSIKMMFPSHTPRRRATKVVTAMAKQHRITPDRILMTNPTTWSKDHSVVACLSVESCSCSAASVSFFAIPASSSTCSFSSASAPASTSLSCSEVANSTSSARSCFRFLLLPIVAPVIVPRFQRRLDILPSFGRGHAFGVPYAQWLRSPNTAIPRNMALCEASI